MEHEPFEDAFPIKHGDIPASYVIVSQRVLYFSLGHLSTNPSLKATDAEYQQMLEGVSVLMADRKDPASLKAALASAGKFDIVFDNNVTSWWFYINIFFCSPRTLGK